MTVHNMRNCKRLNGASSINKRPTPAILPARQPSSDSALAAPPRLSPWLPPLRLQALPTGARSRNAAEAGQIEAHTLVQLGTCTYHGMRLRVGSSTAQVPASKLFDL